MTADSLTSTLRGVKNLPTLPQVAIHLLQLLNDPDSSIEDVNGVMSKAPSLAATVLRIVNSSYYGLRHKVSSLSHALSLLGYRAVKNMVLTAAASGLFRVRKCTACFSEETFTLHSIASAAVCRYLAHFSGVADPEFAFSLGLLHDIGKLTMDQCFPEEYYGAVMWARRNREHAHIAELGQCGYDHSQVGEALATLWKLPQDLSGAIGLHHNHEAIIGNDILALAHIADYACCVKGYSCYDMFIPVELNHDAWKRLGLDANVLPHLFTALGAEIDNAREMLASAVGTSAGSKL